MKLIPASRAAISDGLLLVEVAQRLEVGVAEERRIVEDDLGVERQQRLRPSAA